MRGAGSAAGMQQQRLFRTRHSQSYRRLPRPMRLTFLFFFFRLADCCRLIFPMVFLYFNVNNATVL
jgi:hypothetical protein